MEFPKLRPGVIMRYQIVGFLFFFLFFKTCPVPAVTARASSGQGDYRPELAIDGDMNTRWSSEFSDDQWIVFDLETSKTIVGIRLYWETAYGRDYDIQIEDEKGKWKRAAPVRNGDGGMDEIYFGLRNTKKIRLLGLKRGTGWGYSLWEAEILGKEHERTFQASSTGKDASPEMVMDGDQETSWISGENRKEREWLLISFPEKTSFGGLQISWKGNQSPPCQIQVPRESGEKWRTIYEKGRGGSPLEDIFFSRAEAEKLRILFPGTHRESVGIGEIVLKGPDETWNPVRHFEMLSQRLPPGALPGWLRRKQTFWTVTGLPGEREESLIDEQGRIEPSSKSFSLTPLLLVGDNLQTAEDFGVSQGLEKGWAPIPWVKWRKNDLSLTVTALTVKPGVTVVEYCIENSGTSERDVSLLLAARPLQINPPWQHGGFSPIRDVRWIQNQRSLIVNGREALSTDPAPDFAAVKARDNLDIVERLIEKARTTDAAGDPDGIASAGLRYDLSIQPGNEKTVYVFFPLKHDPSKPVPASMDHSRFLSLKQEYTALWKEWTGNWDLDLPDQRFEDSIRSNLAYLLINADGSAVQPGSRNYQHSWIRDGAVSATAMLRFGLFDPVRKYLEWFTSHVTDDGFVPFLINAETGESPVWSADWKEYDAFGEYAFLVRQFVEITDDTEAMEEVWPRMRAALGEIRRLRKTRLQPSYRGTPFYGILPESNSHEGYFPAKHSFWDDFWALRGLQDGAALAENLGHEDDAKWMKETERALRSSLLVSMDMVRKKHELETLPACVELGDFDPTSTAIGIMAADERDSLSSSALTATFDVYFKNCLERMEEKAGAQYTPYEVRNVSALIRLGRPDDAFRLLDWFLEDAVRPPGWNHMAEVVHDDPRTPSYIGDMPHTWVGAGLINAIRDMFVYEDRGSLNLAAGVPEEWIAQGLSVNNLQTWWGGVSYRLYRDNRGETLLELSCREKPPRGFILPEGVRLILKQDR